MAPSTAVALALTIFAGVNWALIGLVGIDLVAAIFGEGSFLTRAIYIFAGVCALYSVTIFAEIVKAADPVRR